MRIRGWFRLWAVLTFVGVPAAAYWRFTIELHSWEEWTRSAARWCTGDRGVRGIADLVACNHSMGADQNLFQHLGYSPTRWWSETLAAMLGIDLILTALIVVAVFAIRWVIRGFRPATP